MFSLIKKNLSDLEVVDVCFISELAKFYALAMRARADADLIFVCWFRDTKNLLVPKFIAEGIDDKRVQLAETEGRIRTEGKQKIILEHHPNRELEEKFFENVKAKKIEVYNSLSESIFQFMHIDPIVEMMRKWE